MSFGISLPYLTKAEATIQKYDVKENRDKNGKNYMAKLYGLAHKLIRSPLSLIIPSKEGEATTAQEIEQVIAEEKEVNKKGGVANGAHSDFWDFYHNAIKPFISYMKKYATKYLLPEQAQAIQQLEQQKEQTSAALAVYQQNVQGLDHLLKL